MNSEDQKYRLSLLAATLEATNDGILVVDHESRRIQQFNQKFLQLWNIPEEMAARGNDNELIDFVLNQLDSPEQFVNLVMELYQNPMKKSVDRLHFIDGRVFDRFSDALIIDNLVKGRVWYFREITTQIKLQRQLEDQRLKSTNSARMAALGEMAAGIAHEINNPLSVIVARIWHLKALFRKEGENNLEKINQNLEIIESTAERIAVIVKGMRSISRDSSKDPFIAKELAIIIEETLIYCRERFKENEIDLRIELPSLDTKICCHPAQISQIILNLLNNSLDAVNILPEKWVSLKVEEDNSEIKVIVTDSGKGIAPEFQGKLTQPFFTTKPPGKGTGLGLSISQVIAEAHHGEIYLDKDCKNTCFVLSLPKL